MKRIFAALSFLLTFAVARADVLPVGQFILGSPDVATFTAKMGHAPSVVMYSVNFVEDDVLDAWLLDTNQTLEFSPFSNQISTLDLIHASGATPWLGWGLPIQGVDVTPAQAPIAPNINQLLAGSLDSYITQYMTDIKAWDRELKISFLPEFNNYGEASFGGGFSAGINIPVQDLNNQYGDPDVPDGPERVRDAILHVVGIANAVGVPKLDFFMYGSSAYMVPESSQFSDESGLPWNHPSNYYPGDEFIHAVGKSVHFSSIAQFQDYFQYGYDAWGEVTTKPFWVPELGLEKTTSDRSDQIAEVFVSVLPSRPRVQAVAVVDSQFFTGFGTGIGGEQDPPQYPDELSLYQSYLTDIRICNRYLQGVCGN